MATLFQHEPWYQGHAGHEVSLLGNLVELPIRGVSGGRQYCYALQIEQHRYPIYTGAKTEPELQTRVGHAVKITGKLVQLPIDPTRKEIWPATVETA